MKVFVVESILFSIFIVSSLVFMKKVTSTFNITKEVRITSFMGVLGYSIFFFTYFAGYANIGLIFFGISLLVMGTWNITYLLRQSYKENSQYKFEELKKSSSTSLETLDSVLSHKNACARFKDFLINEFSVENILFCEAVDTFRKTSTESQEIHVHYIYEYFIKQNAMNELNVYGQIKKDLTEKILKKYIEINMFEAMLKAVKKQMETDSFVRFRRTVVYNQLRLEQANLASLNALNLV